MLMQSYINEIRARTCLPGPIKYSETNFWIAASVAQIQYKKENKRSLYNTYG